MMALVNPVQNSWSEQQHLEAGISLILRYVEIQADIRFCLFLTCFIPFRSPNCVHSATPKERNGIKMKSDWQRNVKPYPGATDLQTTNNFTQTVLSALKKVGFQ